MRQKKKAAIRAEMFVSSPTLFPFLAPILPENSREHQIPLVLVYIKATAGLCIVSLITDVIATILTGIGLHTKNQNIKYKFYRRAVLVMLVARK